jgi:CcmD family protein
MNYRTPKQIESGNKLPHSKERNHPMLTFMTAYLVVWFAALAYMLRLGGQQRRLQRMAEALQAQFEKQRSSRRRAA